VRREAAEECIVNDTDERPWEKAGQLRRDALPHRGPLLDVLGTASVLCAILAAGPVIPGLLGLPLGVAALLLARRDLSKMRAGLVDRTGQARTEEALRWARWGVLLNLVVLLLAGAMLVWLARSGGLRGPGWS
jgi:hypothetical protein